MVRHQMYDVTGKGIKKGVLHAHAGGLAAPLWELECRETPMKKPSAEWPPLSLNWGIDILLMKLLYWTIYTE